MNTILVILTVALTEGLAYQLGHLQDTPEVAHAKAQHFAAVAKAQAQRTSDAFGKSLWSSDESNSWATSHYAPSVKYHGPIAHSPGYDKHGAPLPVLDTPEVAHAKSAHLAAVSKAGGHIYPAVHTPYLSNDYGSSGYGSWSSGAHNGGAQYAAEHNRYYGPIAHSPGYDKHGAPLPVLDTPEVAHAKSAHLAAVSKAGGHIYPAVHTPYLSNDYGSSGYGSWSSGAHNGGAQYAAEHNRYHGPIAHSPGYDKHGAPLPVLDTPEVAAEKAKHYHMYSQTLANLGKSGYSYNHW